MSSSNEQIGAAEHLRAENTLGDGRFQRLPKEARNLLAGGIAGMTAKSVVAPIDRIKILYQVTSARFQWRNIPRVAYSIVQTEGLSALWKGNTATLIRVFPYSGIQFMVFARCKTYFLDRRRVLDDDSTTVTTTKWGISPIESLLAGSCAGAVSVMCTYPLDLTRAQLAVLKKKKLDSSGKNVNLGFRDVLVGNYKKRGINGLFRGITPTVLGILPYSGVAFTINEQAKREIHAVAGREPTTIERMGCGALSGLVAQSMTYPLEVTRRRMQTIGLVPTSGRDAAVNVLGGTVLTSPAQSAITRAESISTEMAKPPSMVHTISQLMKEQGIRGFFKGVTMNWLKGPIAFSISFTTFDIVQRLMETEDERALRVFKQH